MEKLKGKGVLGETLRVLRRLQLTLDRLGVSVHDARSFARQSDRDRCLTENEHGLHTTSYTLSGLAGLL